MSKKSNLPDLTEKAKQIFSEDKFAKNTTGVEIIEVRPNYAKCMLKVEDRHRNLAGNVMGGVLFTMADYTFAVAVNTEEMNTVTASANIDYLSPLKGDYLFAETKCRKNGKSVCYFQVLIRDEDRNIICECQFVGYHIKTENK